jgi:large subunit ribosomal protein L22
MEVTTIQRYIHTSPRKLRLVADMVRKMEPNHALDILRITQKDAARDLAKALETDLANAKQMGLNEGQVVFEKIEIDESIKLRRYHAGTRGRVKPFKRRMSHIKIVLTDNSDKKLKDQNKNLEKTEMKKEIEVINTKDVKEVAKTKKGGRTEVSKK